MQLPVNIALTVIRIYGFCLVEKLLILLQYGIQILSILHFGTEICNLLIQLLKIQAQHFQNGFVLVFLPVSKLIDSTDAANTIPDQLSGI